MNNELKHGNKYVMSYKKNSWIIALEICGNYCVPDATKRLFCCSIL